MKCLIADDEPLILRDIHRTAIAVLGEDTQFLLAEDSDEAVAAIERESRDKDPVQIAFLDIEMPRISGLEIAKRIQKISPNTNIIFCTGYDKYALEALELYVSGFIMKPVNKSKMTKAVENLRYPIRKLNIKCFGTFEVFFGDSPVRFKRSQSMEVLAYLIDKRGGFVSEDELRYLLWSEEEDTDKKRIYIRNIISDIRSVFRSFGVEDVIINNRMSYYSIDRRKISCDLYDYLDGRLKLSDEEKSTYMKQYDWAEL